MELKAGTLTIKNVSKKPKNLNIYVPNKENLPYKIAPDEEVTVTTLSAGESYAYLMQANEDITVTMGGDSSTSEEGGTSL